MTIKKLLDIINKFQAKYPLEDWDGDGQEFFETVDESDILEFFKDIYEKWDSSV